MPRLKRKSHRRYSHNALDREARERGRENDLNRYGNLLPYVLYLREKDWVVFEERPYYRVGTKLVDTQGLYDIYERVRDRYERQASYGANQELETKRPRRKAKARGVDSSGNSERVNKGGDRKGGRPSVSRSGARKPE